MAGNNKISEAKFLAAVEAQMAKVALSMIDYMESSVTVPVDTHNLKDGLAIATYSNGALTGFYMNPKAKKPRRNIGLAGYEKGDVWGKIEIRKILSRGSAKYSNGLYIVLSSAMPYDVIQDSKGPNKGFFSIDLSNEFIKQVMAEFNLIKKDI